MAAETAKSWFEKGDELKRTGDLPGALDAFRRSLKINPRAAAAWIGLADVLDANQQPSDALECLKHGAKAEPKNAVVATRLARSFHLQGMITEAKAAYERALQIEPGKVSALLGLGSLFEDDGDPQQAARCYRQVLAKEPGHGEALGNIVGLGRDVDVSAEIDAAKLAMESADDQSTALIGYGLGLALERVKRYDEAFNTMAAANEARRSIAGRFQADKFDERIQRMTEIFSTAFFAEREGWGNQSTAPVFVVGLPRSGTTLTEQIIGSHPKCFGAGELPILTDLATGTPDRLGREDPPWPETALELSRTQTEELGSDLVEHLQKRAPAGVCRIVDKQPLNFWHLGLVAMALPNAKIIHCVRDIRDNGLSIFSQNFNPQQRWATDLGDIAHYWQGYRRLMAHWRKVTPLNIIDVIYEDTIADLEGQARRMLEFLGLTWDPRVLEFHENVRTVQTPSKWQVRQPLYTSSKAKWRHYSDYIKPLIDARSNSSS
ncbi:MAG: sulfotransferase [Pseudomonadota bacterium]